MRDKLEDIAVVIFGSVIVILFCAVYWICRICGVRLEDDF
jgi:hypothetical protein